MEHVTLLLKLGLYDKIPFQYKFSNVFAKKMPASNALASTSTAPKRAWIFLLKLAMKFPLWSLTTTAIATAF